MKTVIVIHISSMALISNLLLSFDNKIAVLVFLCVDLQRWRNMRKIFIKEWNRTVKTYAQIIATALEVSQILVLLTANLYRTYHKLS